MEAKFDVMEKDYLRSFPLFFLFFFSLKWLNFDPKFIFVLQKIVDLIEIGSWR